jgi:hypothetical protein
MSNTNTGGPAFPTQSKLGVNDTSTWIAEIPGQPGMTLRDYFAAKAMQGMFASSLVPQNVTNEELSTEAYNVADAMLKAREA